MIGFLLFPELTALDLVGPHEVLSRLPVPSVLVAATARPVPATRGLTLVPDAVFEDCPELELLVVPGGAGQDAAAADPRTLDFVRDRARLADAVLSVCTGTLLLAATGLLAGRRASTHWLARRELARLGAVPVPDRVCADGPYWSGAGVSAGIDAAFALVAHRHGTETAQEIQLAMEYRPRPPLDAGSPETAPRWLVDKLRAASRFEQPDG